jgi:hypothetical protein
MIKKGFAETKALLRKWFSEKISNINIEKHSIQNKLAWYLYKGWLSDWKMNSEDKNIVFEGTKEGMQANKKRNELLENIENYYASKQKNKGKPTTESIAACIDRAIITYMKIINCKEKERKKELQNQLGFILDCADKLYADIMTGKRKIIVFSHLKEYMQ